jgi:hypothetical protein
MMSSVRTAHITLEAAVDHVQTVLQVGDGWMIYASGLDDNTRGPDDPSCDA